MLKYLPQSLSQWHKLSYMDNPICHTSSVSIYITTLEIDKKAQVYTFLYLCNLQLSHKCFKFDVTCRQTIMLPVLERNERQVTEFGLNKIRDPYLFTDMKGINEGCLKLA